MTTTSTPETPAIPDYVGVLVTVRRDMSDGRWLRTVIVPGASSSPSEHFPVPDSTMNFVVATQREKAPWKFDGRVSWEWMTSSRYRMRRAGLIASHEGPYDGGPDSNLWGTYMFRILFTIIPRDDYLKIIAFKSPSYGGVRRIFADLEAEIVKQFPELATPASAS